MLLARIPAEAKRRALRAGLDSGRLLRLPGAFSPLVSPLVARHGFEGVYISGAVLANDLGLPDIGLTTATEVATRAGQIARTTDLPALVDADTGFGEPMNAARTVELLEDAGLAGLHLEDQVNPKRCGHLDHKAVVDTATMVRRLRAAVSLRRDPNFVICARTDAREIEGLQAAIDRAKAYVDAGADMVFAEAMHDAADIAAFRQAVGVPLLVNMTEFGKSELLTTAQLEDLGVNVVIYPVTTLRIALGAVDRGLSRIAAEGTQRAVVPEMMTRAELYDLLDYADYTVFDEQVFDFSVSDRAAPGGEATDTTTTTKEADPR